MKGDDPIVAQQFLAFLIVVMSFVALYIASRTAYIIFLIVRTKFFWTPKYGDNIIVIGAGWKRWKVDNVAHDAFGITDGIVTSRPTYTKQAVLYLGKK